MDIIELFSGMGSQAKALTELQVEYELLHTCDWNIHSMVAYDYIHNNNEIHEEAIGLTRDQLLEILIPLNLSADGKVLMTERLLRSYNEDSLRKIYSAILKTNNLVDITQVNGAQLPENIDLLTYSFPCQDLSNVGAIHGFNQGIDRNANNRSGLLWEVERILKQRRDANLPLPKYLMLENVTALMSARHLTNFNEWKSFLDDLGYVSKPYKLNARNFSLPQNRNRVIMLSVLCEDAQRVQVQDYFNDNDLSNVQFPLNPLANYLRTNYANATYFQEANESQPNDTPSRQQMWIDNKVILDNMGVYTDYVNTITTKQDRNPNAGNIYYPAQALGKSNYRFLTPRECFLLMGFSENDFDNVINNNFDYRGQRPYFSRDILRKMAGNSIAVCVLTAVFEQLLEIEEQIFGNRF